MRREREGDIRVGKQLGPHRRTGQELEAEAVAAEQHAEKVEPSQIETIKDMLINGLLRHYFSIAIAADHQISRTVRS